MTIVVTTLGQTTALDIIKRSFRLLGVYATGEEPSAQESADSLSALNSLMASLGAPMVYAKTLDAITIAPGTASVTVGPSGNTVTDRPVRIDAETSFLIGTTTYALTVATDRQYADIAYKAQAGIPCVVWPLMNMPDVTLTLWPVPSLAGTLQLWSDKVVGSFPGLTSIVSLPPGYDRLLAFLLAIDIAPEYEVTPSPLVMQNAANARRTIEAANFQVPMLTLPPEVAGCYGFNILTGNLR